MAHEAARVFEDRPAARGPTPLLFGLIGPSGSGKTYSALRLATGMQRVLGGDIFVIDTESSRALHYAERFKFRHVPFVAPFAPGDYLDAIEHCARKGAKIVIVDSMSHEHEGPGGVLEWHDREVERLMSAWGCREDKANIPAWGKPKAARRRLINTVIQMPVNFIFCFRAKDKIKIGRGKDGKSEVATMGFMPIAGEEFVYELTAKALLLPGANGVPTWQSENQGERMMIKLPEHFKGFFDGSNPTQLDEAVGAQLATWAAGDVPVNVRAADYAAITTQAALDELETRRAKAWPTLTPAEKKPIKAASDAAAARLRSGAAATPATTTSSSAEPDYEALKAAMKDARTPDAGETAWKAIEAAYAGREIPLELEALYDEKRDSFRASQQQG